MWSFGLILRKLGRQKLNLIRPFPLMLICWLTSELLPSHLASGPDLCSHARTPEKSHVVAARSSRHVSRFPWGSKTCWGRKGHEQTSDSRKDSDANKGRGPHDHCNKYVRTILLSIHWPLPQTIIDHLTIHIKGTRAENGGPTKPNGSLPRTSLVATSLGHTNGLSRPGCSI